MGCCISSEAKTNPHHSAPKKRSYVTPPPPASFEEETVKEVLSETPIPKPPPPPPPETAPPLTQQKIPQIPTNKAPIFAQIPTNVPEPRSQAPIFTNKKRFKEEVETTPEISQASEICSVANTYSTATTATTTTTVTEIKEDEVTSKERVNRSPAKVQRKRLYNGERERVPRVPARRERPPVKKEFSGQVRSQQQRNNVGYSRAGRDPGERSGRRSRSPATRPNAGGVIKGRAGGSPAKVTGKSGGKPVEAGEGSEVKKEEEKQNDDVAMLQQQQQGNESLENPLVSLECFIFL